ncbi:MAG: TlpA family protein disulfide reductase [Nitrospinae bacterium]|nr:TlpA family protein disulfide reductase [Nitrospinota bacterium]
MKNFKFQISNFKLYYILILLFLIAISCSSPESTDNSKEEKTAKVSEPKPAQDFTLKDLNGNEVKLSSLKGKPVIINFWATWCYPCREEIPDLQKSYDENKDKGLVILGVNIKENVSKVSKFSKDYKMTYPILLDIEGTISDAYRVFGIPMSFFIDRDGLIKDSFIGMLTKEDLSKKLAAIL